MEGVTLITSTGGRPEAFELCRSYVLRQTYAGPIQWIVVDDCDPPQTINPEAFAARGIEIKQLFPRPVWLPGQNTLSRNLLAAFPAVSYDRIFFIEDDDWYAPDYLTAQLEQMGDAVMVGEIPAVYYNVEHRLYAFLNNRRHASLCQTGIDRKLLPDLALVCEAPDSIDIRLWHRNPAYQKFLHEAHRSVGIKGMPGRAGLGSGHRPKAQGMRWSYDNDWRVLRSLIGDDYLQYRAIYTKPMEGDFEIFFWAGQKRYKCNQKWESGGPCQFDTYNLQELMAHIATPHTYTGRRATPTAPPRKVLSPVLGPDGRPVEREVSEDK